MYIIGLTNREYVIEGITLPKKTYSDREKELGRSPVLQISDSTYTTLSGNPTFRNLIKNKQFVIKDALPDEFATTQILRERHQSEIARLRERIAELEQSNGVVLPEGALSAEDAAVIQVEKKAALETAEALKKEALEEISLRDAKIAELENNSRIGQNRIDQLIKAIEELGGTIPKASRK